MAKNKYVSSNEIQYLFFKDEWQVIPRESSPFSEIKLPPNTLLVTGSASIDRLTNYSGPSIAAAGIDIYRYDPKDYPFTINVDHYSAVSTEDPTKFKLDYSKPQNHWVSSVNQLGSQVTSALPSNLIDRLDSWLSLGTIASIAVPKTNDQNT
jgi:hypothetical protein